MAITIRPDSPLKVTTTEDKKTIEINKSDNSVNLTTETTSVVSVTAPGPRGQKGDTGDTGAQGPQGISGFSGSAESSSISTRLTTAESELGNTLISSSAQIASDISGSFTNASSSFSTRITSTESELGNTLISSSAQISSDISGSFTNLSSSLSTRLTTDETNITNLQTDSGSFSTRITTAESELGNTLISSSAQIASDISGSTTSLSGSLSTRLTTDETNITNLQTDSGSFSTRITTAETELTNTIISSSAQIASDISGSFTSVSSSFSTRISTNETELSNTLISSSAQIASDISGSFGNQRVGTTDDVDFASVTTTGNVSVGGNLDVSGTTTSIDSATLNIGDKNITIGSGSTTSVQLDSGGIDFGLGGTIANLRYRHSDTSITSSVDFRAPNFYGIFNGALSSSAQIASNISGSFTAASSSFSTRITTAETELGNTLISSSAQVDLSQATGTAANATNAVNADNIALSADSTNTNRYVPFTSTADGDGELRTDAGLLYNPSTNTITTTTFNGDLSGNATTATTATNVAFSGITSKPTLLSGSAQIADDISGSFTESSASFSTRITTAETELSNTLISSSAQIASDISGSFTAGTGLDLSSGQFSVDVSDFMSNGVDNRVLTATGTDAFNAEANLTFDGNVLEVTHISASGNISGSEGRFSGDVIAFYSSDKRLKDNIIPISNPIEKIKSIGGYEFDWNNNQSTYEGHDIGVIAQEIEDVLPELVTTRNTGYKAVKYEKIIALLIEGIKEQQKQIDELKNKS